MNREPLDENRPSAGNGMDDLLKEVFREDAPPPEVEDRLRDRMATFRDRLDAREERDRQPSRWAFLRAPRTLTRLAIAGSAACAVVAAVIALQSLYQNEFAIQSKVTRVRNDHRSLGTAIEGYYVDNNAYPYTYDPTQGTVSMGDLWRVREETDKLGIANGNEVSSMEELSMVKRGSEFINGELAAKPTPMPKGTPWTRTGDVDSDGDIDGFYSTNGNASPSIEAVVGDRVVFGRRAPAVIGDGNLHERYVPATGVGTASDQVASASAPAPNEEIAGKIFTIVPSPTTTRYGNVRDVRVKQHREGILPSPGAAMQAPSTVNGSRLRHGNSNGQPIDMPAREASGYSALRATGDGQYTPTEAELRQVQEILRLRDVEKKAKTDQATRGSVAAAQSTAGPNQNGAAVVQDDGYLAFHNFSAADLPDSTAANRPAKHSVGMTINSVPDVFIGPESDANSPSSGTDRFRYGDSVILWDSVSPGVMQDGFSKDTPYWAWAAKSAGLTQPTTDFRAGNFHYPSVKDNSAEVSPQEIAANIKAEVDKLVKPAPTPEPLSTTPDYDRIIENPFLPAKENPLSTFSIDVDTASYSNIRRLLMDQQLPPADAVRIEEMINYFPYDYPQPTDDAPFSVTTDVATCPWAPDHRLLRIGLKGYEIPAEQRPASNLVFLIDVSGSMNSPEKLPLLKEGFKVFVHHLKAEDRVAIVVYAGASGLVLPSTPATDRQAILDAIDRLQSGGSTNGGAGIQLAYDIAVQNFIEGGVNRVILATDGDFNVGITDRKELVRLIEAEAKSGVFLSVLGYGICGCKDATMEELSNKGNGNYAYIDDALEARRVLVDQMSATLVTIAKDVKIQVEFNPAEVAAYRLIGYENRMLAKEDFNDDTKDAGEIGAGHTVTALYELVPAQAATSESESESESASPSPSDRSDPTDPSDQSGQLNQAARENDSDPAPCPDPADADTAHVPPPVDALKYQESDQLSAAASSGELLTVKLRYKQPDGNTSRRLEYGVVDNGDSLDAASPDFKFAAGVAGFGLLLRDSAYKGNATFQSIYDLAMEGIGADPYTYRREFVDLVELAAALRGTPIDGGQK